MRRVKSRRVRHFVTRLKQRFSPQRQFPWPLRNEIRAVTDVLQSSQWNMGYGVNLVHEKLEREFAKFTHSAAAIAVSSGGMALQIAMRALGLRPGDEVIHQVDTCVANPFAIFAAGATPIFADSNGVTFGISVESLSQCIGRETKAITLVHLWGNADNITAVELIARNHSLALIEDCCLALGTISDGQHVGNRGSVGVFSFGCVKPIQAGEGGMIVTNDLALAREMRCIRGWGERLREFGTSDIHTLSWNGRMSEIVAAVALEQLRGYPQLLSQVRNNAKAFIQYLSRFEWVRPIHTTESSYSQLVLQIDKTVPKSLLVRELQSQGVGSESVNFEPATRYSFFKHDHWKPWVPGPLQERTRQNYLSRFPNADSIYDETGLGIARNNFLGPRAVQTLIQRWEKAVIGIDRARRGARAA